MLKAGIGGSAGVDAYREGANAARQALHQIGEERANAYIVFAAVTYDQQRLLDGIVSVVGNNALIVGCTTAGEITTEGPSNRDSVVVMAIYSDNLKFYSAVGSDIKDDARKAGNSVARQIVDQVGGKPDVFMMFPDVLVGNGAEIVRGVTEVLGASFPVVGGAAGDGFKFEKTFQYINGRVVTGSVVGLGIVGPIKVGIGVKHGWIPIGTPRKVTKSIGSVIYELDHKPAIEIYREYFGKEAVDLEKEKLAKLAITYPLGIKNPSNDEMLIRDPLTVDEHGSITCAAEVPQGSDVQIMIGSFEDAIIAAEDAARGAMEQISGFEPKAVVLFNCIARHKLFGERSGEEIRAIRTVIGRDVPIIGFYTYGEQAPISGETRDISKCNPEFHNETIVILILGE